MQIFSKHTLLYRFFKTFDSLAAAIGIDYNGKPHLAWLQDTVLRYAVPFDTSFKIVKLCSAQPSRYQPRVDSPHEKRIVISLQASG